MMKRIIRLLIILIISIGFFSNIFVSWNALNIRANQPPIADAGQDQNVDAGIIVNFDGSGSFDPDNDPLNYKWNFADGNSTGWQNNCNASHTYTIGGKYIANLTVSDGSLTDIDSCIIDVTGKDSSGMTKVSGTISSDTKWTKANSPYVLDPGWVSVADSATLTIEPGVIVKINDALKLKIYGTLIAKGTSTNNIIFTSNSSTPAPGDWDSIDFEGASDDCILKWVIIEYGTNGIKTDYQSDPKIESCIIQKNVIGVFGDARIKSSWIHNNTEQGVYFYSPELGRIMVGSLIENNSYDGIRVDQVCVNISNCIIKNNKGHGISFHWSNPDSEIYRCEIRDNSKSGVFIQSNHTINIINSTIIKNSKDGVTITGITWVGDCEMHLTNIFQNNNFDFNNSGNNNIDATYNYWGTTNTGTIDQNIYDYYDDLFLGKVIYTSILTQFNPNKPVIGLNQPPVADAGSDQSASTNQTMYFDGSGSYDPDNDPLKYKWDFGDGSSTGWQNNCNATHSYIQIGNYTVILSVKDGQLLDMDSCKVQVINQPPLANAGPDQNATANQTVYFDGSGSNDPDGDPLTYNWNFGDGTTSGWQNDCNSSHSYSSTGNYFVTLTISDGSLQDIDTCVVIVTSGGTTPTPPYDSDGDGISDSDEIKYGTYHDDADSDDDGILDGAEKGWNNDTDGDAIINARETDSDNDGIYDGTEVGISNSDLHPDTDITRGYFVIDQDNTTVTDPTNWDTDGDGKADGDEDKNHNGKYEPELDETDPLFPDTDEDGIPNSDDPDDDNDGIPDWWEELFSDALDRKDSSDAIEDYDNDGFTNLEEYLGDDGVDGEFDDSSDPMDPSSFPEPYENQPPVVFVYVTATKLEVGKKISFYANGTNDPDGDTIIIYWYSNIDGLFAEGMAARNIILSEGIHNISVKVRDGRHESYAYLEIIIYGANETDTDGDGYPDIIDIFPLDPTEWLDSDGDTVGDNSDAYPLDPERYLKEKVDDENDSGLFTIIFMIMIVVIVIIIILTLFVFRKKKQRSTEPIDYINELQNEALTPHKPSDLDLSDQELLTQFEAKHREGKISQETYDLIQEKLGYK